MSVEDSNDHIPVKDNYDNYGAKVRGNNPKITRDEIEDRYLRVSEENLILKKHLRKQEEKIKQLATKLVRLVGDRNNREKRGDILVDDQKCRISELEAQVHSLGDKLLVARQQLASYTKLVPGINKHIKQQPTRSVKNISTPPTHVHSEGSTAVTDHVTHLLMEARAENQALKDRLQVLHGHMSSNEIELSNMKEEIALKEVERQDEMMIMRSQMEIENESKKKKLADNVQIIRLQRDSKRTASWLATYEAQCRTLESNLNLANENLGQVEFQLSDVQEELRLEQHKTLGLMKQVEDFSSVANQLKELEARLKSLQEENKILKEGHESLVAKAMENGDKIKRVENEESTYKNQVTQLENTVRAELQAKAELIAMLNQEKAKCLSIEQGFRELEIKYEQMSEALRNTEVRLEEADSKLSADIKLPDSCEGCGRLETDLNEVQWQLVQVREELTKTKNLLKTQISINKEYQKEIEILSTKLEKSEIFHHDKLQEFMRILEERADQMTHFEKSMESMNLRPVTPPVILPQLQSTSSIPDPTLTLTLPEPNIGTTSLSDDLLPIPTLVEEPKISSTTSVTKIDIPAVSRAPPQRQKSLDRIPLAIRNLPPQTIEIPTTTTPTIEVYIDKYIPAMGATTTLSSGLFVTWEAEESARNYSPMVTNGVFNTRSRHVLKENFPLEGIEVQLHQAVGEHHSRMLATAFIVLGSNVSVSMHSVDNEEILGDLVYSCTVVMIPPVDQKPAEVEASDNVESDLQNNNVEIKEKPEPETEPPVPRPKPKPKPRVQSEPTAAPKDDGSDLEIPTVFRKSSDPKSPKKSILRRDGSPASPKGQKHVSVDPEIMDERDIPNEVHTEMKPEHEPEIEILSNIPEEFSGVSSVTEQRKKHRRKKPKKSKPIVEEEESELTYSLESGTETSRNVSDIDGDVDEEFGETVMRVEISYVQFNEKCRMWTDPNVKKFFVEYNFLNYPSEELETETSLHKPQPGHRAQFNFVKVFLIDTSEKRKLLREMLKERKRLRFTLVSEPAEDDTIDCEDLGYAYICFNDILQEDADLIEEEIPIYDAENHRIQVGVICVSVQAVQVLKTL